MPTRRRPRAWAARASPRWPRRAIPRATIKADRAQHSFKLSLDQFMEKRGAATIVSQGTKLKAQNAKLFATLEKRYGVPPGPLIAIWGMETAFGAYMGKQNTISAVATLAYDCRRPEFFREQLIAALKLVDKGVLSSSSIGAMHGEVGQTQFLPKNVFLYGADGDGGGINLNKKADALASTANFLSGHGWQPRRGLPARPGQFRGAPGLERRKRLSEGARHHGPPDRRRLRVAVFKNEQKHPFYKPLWRRVAIVAVDRPVARASNSGRRSSGLWIAIAGGMLGLCGLHLLHHMAEGRARRMTGARTA